MISAWRIACSSFPIEDRKQFRRLAKIKQALQLNPWSPVDQEICKCLVYRPWFSGHRNECIRPQFLLIESLSALVTESGTRGVPPSSSRYRGRSSDEGLFRNPPRCRRLSPTELDRAMQALYLLALLPVAEEETYPHSYGFRPYRSVADAIEQCFKFLSHSYDPQWVLEGDIVGCFDNIDHDWLLQYVRMDRKMLEKWLKSGFIDGRSLHPTLAGTPQGGIISPTAAVITLSGLGIVDGII